MIILSETHKANLEKLATYLENLPDDYEHFDMELFYWRGGFVLPDQDAIAPQSCGAVACAIGHGPAAGVPVPEGIDDWFVYCFRSFGISLDDFSSPEQFEAGQFAFDEFWAGTSQPKAKHAAQRIRILLEHGEPPSDWSFDDGPYGEES